MKDNITYLYERQYKKDSKDKEIDSDRKNLITAVLGKQFLNNLCKFTPEIFAYLTNQKFDINELFYEEKAITSNYCGRRKNAKILEYMEEKRLFINFSKFYTKYIAIGLGLFNSKLQNPEICNDDVITNFLDTLLNKLQKICLRILIYEIQVYKKNGLLQGTDTKEEYDYFMNKIVDDNWISGLEQKYPIMTRSIEEVIESAVLLYSDAINSLNNDKYEIAQKLCHNHSFNKIEKIQGDIADSHCEGKSVLRIYLNNGYQIIYKPHNIENEKVFQSFMAHMGKMVNTNMYSLAMIERNNYGWVECVDNKPCTNQEQVQDYYKRMGIYIFAFYLLGTNDIHNENIIASGEYPVIVDLENIVGAPIDLEGLDIVERIQLFLKNSVLYSGALPSFKWSREGANVNISGVGGNGRNELPFKMPKVINEGTSEIKITFYHPSFDQQANVPTLNNKKLNPACYLTQILEGFRLAYDKTVENKSKVKSWLGEFENLKSRYLLADTQRYAMCLNSSYNPLLMDDGAKRQMYLYTMWYGRDMNSRIDKEIVESEIRDLLGHDIPYFYFKVSGTGVYDSRGKEIKTYFNKNPYLSLLDKVDCLNKKDRNHQSELIEMTIKLQERTENSLMNANIPINIVNRYGKFASKDKLLHVSEKIGDSLINNSVQFRSGDIGWYMASVTTRGEFSWKIQPIDMYMYGGVMGINMFFHSLCCYIKQSKYRNVTKVLDGQLFAYTDNLFERKKPKLSTGIYNGEASILKGYLHIYQMTGAKKYLEYAEKHARIVKQCMSREENFDLLDGLAGAVVGLMELYAVKNSEEILEAAAEGGNKLLDCAVLTPQGMCWKNRLDDVPLLGISHGTAGIMIAFAKLYEATGQQKYYDAMAASLAYENANYDEELNNWIDFRANPDKRKEADTVAWCHGAGGVLMSRLAILNVVKDKLKDVVCRDIERAVSKLEDKWMREGLCLCHGSCGNLLMLKKYADVMEDKEMKKRILEYAGQLASLIEKEEWLLQEKYNPGLMNGYTGVGMSMLMLSEIFREDETKIIT